MPRARDVHTEYVHQALQRLNFFTEPIRENLFFPGLTSCSPDSVLITQVFQIVSYVICSHS